MRIIAKRIIAILIVMTMIFQFNIVSVFAEQSSDGVSEFDNNFVKVRVKNEDGRFTIKTKEGNPARMNDDDERLLFEEFEPETSFTTFRIDGKDYIYGNDYGFLGLGGHFINQPSISDDGMVNASTWKVGNVEIAQYLELVDDPENENAGNVKIRYEVTNKGSSSTEVGSRMLLDTMIGSNDGAPLVLGTDLNSVTMEKELTGDDIPLYYRSMDDYFAPNIMAYGFLEGWGNVRPDKMIVGHYEGLSTTKWDYTIDPALKFTDNSNQYGSADSSIALYWNPTTVGAGETKVFETYYGVGNVKSSGEEANFDLKLISPDKLTVNSDKTNYKDGSFDIVVQLDNTISGIEDINDVQVSLILGDGLAADSEEVIYRHFDTIAANEIKNMTFKVKALPQNSYKLLKYRVDITTANINDPISYNKYIIAPGLNGTPPDIQYKSVSPSNVYYQGAKVFSINGTGYDFYADKTKWNMYLESSVTEQRILVDRDYITVSGNDKITVNYPENLELGEYKIIMESTVLGTEEEIPHTVTASDDKKYMAKAYGLMAIVKYVTVENNAAKNFEYKAIMLEGEDAVNSLKEDIKATNAQTKTSGSGTLRQLLLEVRGDILETNNGDAKRYIINTNSVPATLNGVVQYNGDPMIIDYDTNTGIKLQGNGDLNLVGGFNFWKWEFETTLDKGKDYSLDAISEDDVKNVDPSHRDKFIEKNIEYLYVREPIHAQKDVTIQFTGIGQMAKYMGGFLIQIDDVILKDKAVSFGGSMALTFLPSNSDDPFGFAADIDEVLFKQNNDGNTEFEGINVTTEIGLPEDMIGGILENGGSASLTINTIDKIYSIEATMEIKTIECTGLLTVRFTDDNKPVLDDLEFSASVPKIPVFPPTLYINKLGGGINDLYGTITGDVTAPPLKVLLIAGIELIDENMFQGEVRITVSKLMLSITGELELVPLSSTIMRNAHIEARWADPWYISLGAELDILDMLVGSIDVYVSSTWFEGKAKAMLQIPKSAPIIGGTKFAEASLGVNSNKIWGSVYIKIWLPFKTRKIGVGVAYYWDGGLKVADASGGSYTSKGLYEETLFLDDGKPMKMVVGTNLKKIGDSRNSAKYAYIGDNLGIPNLYASADETEHYFNVYNQEIAVFQIDYDGTQPEDMRLYKPDGREYPLVSPQGDKAYVIKEGENGAKNELYIFVPSPDNGTWRLILDKPVQSTFLEMQEVPQLESVNANKTSETTIDVNWTTTNAEESLVNISLVSDGAEEEAGILLEKDIEAKLGNYSVDIPKSIVEGDYKIKVELKEKDYGYQAMNSASMHITNPDSPEAVNNVQLELLGNGQIGVQFDNVVDEDVVGYYLEVFTTSGEKVNEVGEYFIDQGTNYGVIGGKYKSKEILDENGNVVAPSEELGLDTGASYKVGITTLKETGSTQLISSTTYSENIYLPKPNPATITLGLDNDNTTGQDEEGNDIVIIKDNNAIINFSSNQNVNATVKINDNIYSTFSGTEKKIIFPVDDGKYSVEVICKNNNKDISSKITNFTVDTTPPVLLIESPSDDVQSAIGQVLVSGVSEPDAQVLINGKLIDTDNDGKFESVVAIDDVMKKTIIVEARDQANNVSKFETEIINAESQDIVKVFIRPELKNMRQGMSQRFALIGIDSNGNEITLDNSMVKWSLINGSTLAEVTHEGQLTAYKTGKIVVVGSYYVSDAYAFEDAMTINIVDNDDFNGLVDVAIKDGSKRIVAGSSTSITLVGVDSLGNEVSIDQSLVKWSITSGALLASVYDNGAFKARRAGTVTLKGTYAFTPTDVFEDTISINIHPSNIDDTNPDEGDNVVNDEINEELQDILNNIISKEKDVIVLAMENVSKDMDNDIIAGSQLSLKVPMGAVNKADAILVGKVKDDSDYSKKASNQKLKNVTSMYEIQFAQSSGVLEKPVELSFKIEKQDIENLESVGVYYFNEKYGKWEYIGGELVGDEIKVKINHFSKYAVLESEKSLNMIDIEGIWSEEYIKKLVSLDIINGVDKNGLRYFEPSRSIKRLELAAMICRVMLGEESEGENPPFDDWSDIPEWGKTYVKIAYDNGWIKGRNTESSLLFSPNDYATRGEVATIIGRMIEMENVKPINFTDGTDIPSWAREQVAKLVEAGIIGGYPDGSFKPNNYITRQEVAKVLSTFIEKQNQ